MYCTYILYDTYLHRWWFGTLFYHYSPSSMSILGIYLKLQWSTHQNGFLGLISRQSQDGCFKILGHFISRNLGQDDWNHLVADRKVARRGNLYIPWRWFFQGWCTPSHWHCFRLNPCYGLFWKHQTFEVWDTWEGNTYPKNPFPAQLSRWIFSEVTKRFRYQEWRVSCTLSGL